MGKILRVNMTDGNVQYQDTPEGFLGLGGRGLTSSIVAAEVPPKCDALGPENKIVFAPGTLSGTSCPNSGRLSIGGKSPLTGGIKESNVGGNGSMKIARIGLDAIIIEGKATENLFMLVLKKDSGELVLADEFKVMGTYALTGALKAKYGEKTSIICVGPAGEMLLKSASIQVTDVDGNPCRAAGRGGLGALMGSKGLKAIIVDDTGGESPAIANTDMFKSGQKKFVEAVRQHPLTGEGMPALGTAMLVGAINAVGAFPSLNARTGVYEKWEQISGEKLAEIISSRGGQTTHTGCSNCIIRCSNVFVDKDKNYVTSALEYETIWSMGGMCDISDFDTIARLDYLCDDIGLDTMNTGCALAVAMEAGIKEFGDREGALELVAEVAKGSEIGLLIGNGPAAVGEKYGVKRVPAVKNQSVAAYDPRAIQGIGVTYAASTMGADHTSGFAVGANLEALGGELNPLSPDGQVDATREIMIQTAASDSTGLCLFVAFPLGDIPSAAEGLMEMINGKYGTSLGPDDVTGLGKVILGTERKFNINAGFTKDDDRLPEFYYKEPLPPHNKTFLVTNEDLDSVYNF
ncbi:MAG: aldehyde ferredoxin oxidoreductase C-terminal domain-containing protein [Thermodesulfobacteriota bacterium]|nr:aldehyde ferredoxin oxidoreductase C-terminal domain-containing protein [Thermodesulfobacteriota bacterium]